MISYSKYVYIQFLRYNSEEHNISGKYYRCDLGGAETMKKTTCYLFYGIFTITISSFMDNLCMATCRYWKLSQGINVSEHNVPVFFLRFFA